MISITKSMIILTAAIFVLGTASTAMAMAKKSSGHWQSRNEAAVSHVILDDNGNVIGQDPNPWVRQNLKRAAYDRNR